MSFFHGIRTKKVATAGGVIVVNMSSVIGIVGVSPFGPTQELVLCNNPADDAQFGSATPDNSIAKTLAIIRAMVAGASDQPSDGSCPIVVVNVYNGGFTGDATQTITPDAVTGKATIGKTLCAADLSTIAIVISPAGDPVNVAAGGDYVFGTDYTLDQWGNFVDKTGTYKGVALDFVTPTYLDTSEVAGTDIVGGISSDVRSGSYLFDLVEGRWGFKVKVLICPLYNTLDGVNNKLETLAGSYRGVYLSDTDDGVGPTAALALRGTGLWATSKPQTRPIFPWMKYPDAFAGADITYPFAAFLAGMYVANDLNVGFWQSVSNQEIPGVSGVGVEITTGYSDPNSEANLLNGAGILCYNKAFGEGFKTWGNRNASFPSDNTVMTFDIVYRTDGMVSDAMETAARKYNDRNITASLIDIIKQEGQSFIMELIGQGALLPGSSITYDKTKNSPAALAAGQITFTRRYMVSTPAEIIEFLDDLDISLYQIG